MDIRQLQYLAALAREKHFTRAAAACSVTQPTLSGRIRQLEQELGVPIVARGQRYIGLTPEGERVLRWALTILDNWGNLLQEIGQLRAGSAHIGGRMALGVIPSALPMVSLLTSKIQERYPGIDFTILSYSSIEIVEALGDFTIDAGVTYLDNEPIDGLAAAPLYRERYCLFVRDSDPAADRADITWAEAARHPLCLLTPNMQNRRIIDRAFAVAKAQPAPRVETNSIVNLYANVRQMGLATILPEYFFDALGSLPSMRAVPLIEPLLEHSVGLVTLKREPQPPLISAFFELAKGLYPDEHSAGPTPAV
jgi:DNA-binding transcriptional LysR family regulator